MMHSIMKPFLLRRLKTDVALDLPPKKELIVYCPLSPKQRDLYKYVLDKNMEKLLVSIFLKFLYKFLINIQQCVM